MDDDCVVRYEYESSLIYCNLMLQPQVRFLETYILTYVRCSRHPPQPEMSESKCIVSMDRDMIDVHMLTPGLTKERSPERWMHYLYQWNLLSTLNNPSKCVPISVSQPASCKPYFNTIATLHKERNITETAADFCKGENETVYSPDDPCFYFALNIWYLLRMAGDQRLTITLDVFHTTLSSRFAQYFDPSLCEYGLESESRANVLQQRKARQERAAELRAQAAKEMVEAKKAEKEMLKQKKILAKERQAFCKKIKQSIDRGVSLTNVAPVKRNQPKYKPIKVADLE